MLKISFEVRRLQVGLAGQRAVIPHTHNGPILADFRNAQLQMLQRQGHESRIDGTDRSFLGKLSRIAVSGAHGCGGRRRPIEVRVLTKSATVVHNWQVECVV